MQKYILIKIFLLLKIKNMILLFILNTMKKYIIKLWYILILKSKKYIGRGR